jgi:hypothetical protein
MKEICSDIKLKDGYSSQISDIHIAKSRGLCKKVVHNNRSNYTVHIYMLRVCSLFVYPNNSTLL